MAHLDSASLPPTFSETPARLARLKSGFSRIHGEKSLSTPKVPFTRCSCAKIATCGGALQFTTVFPDTTAPQKKFWREGELTKLPSKQATVYPLCDRVRASGLAIEVLFHSLFVSDLLTPTRQVNDGCTATQLGLSYLFCVPFSGLGVVNEGIRINLLFSCVLRT